MDGKRSDGEQLVLAAWGEVIRRYRHWKQLSRRELAQRAGVSSVFLGEIERGEKDASAHTLCLLADGLDVPLTELYLRVAARLDRGVYRSEQVQTSLPLMVREMSGEYLDAVSAARDETAFDLYRVVRLLPADQQVSLLLLAQSLISSIQQLKHESVELVDSGPPR